VYGVLVCQTRVKLKLSRGLQWSTFRLNLSRFGHTSTCPRLIDLRKMMHPTYAHVKLSVGVTCHPYLLEIEGLCTRGWRPGRWDGGILEMDSSDWHWSNRIRYHTIDTRPDTEFNLRRVAHKNTPCTPRNIPLHPLNDPSNNPSTHPLKKWRSASPCRG